METKDCIITRRSIRRFSGDKVDRNIIKEIIEMSRFAPSWKNTQIVRYYAIEDPEVINDIADNCVLGFEMNQKTIKNSPMLIVVTYKEGISGYEKSGEPTTEQGAHWESFDAGIATQTLCLSAHEKGLGTVIMGIYSDKKVSKAVGIPEGQKVAALVAIGYPAKAATAPKRKEVDDLLQFV